MFASKVKVAVAVLMTVSALGVGLNVSQHASPGGGQAGAGRVATRYNAGGFHSLRGFTFRGVVPKAGSPGGDCEKPEALDREYKDILVEVREQLTGSLLFGIGVNSDAALTGSVVLNERNFDVLRPPTRYDELLSGSAFRGAGQEFRIETVPSALEGFKFSGDFLFLNSVEYQVPVRANDGIFQGPFGDGGTVGQKVVIKDYRVSAGFGVRLAILMLGSAPTGQDSASPSVKRSEAPERLFGFWMG